MSDSSEFAAIMGAVAMAVMPEFKPHNKGLSKADDLRFGKKGSFSVTPSKGVWADHEDGEGGGVLDMLRVYKGLEKPEALEWLVEKGFLQRREREDEARGGGKAIGAFDGRVPDWLKTKPVAIFEYFDDRGRLAYEVLKFPKDGDGSPYMQRRPHPDGGWIWGLRAGDYGRTRGGDWFKNKMDTQYKRVEHFDDARWWLYRRDEVLRAKAEGRPVLLVEGEKDVETLRAWGFTATTNQGGAKNWKPELNEDLAGADLVLMSDNDNAGHARVQMRGADLRPIARSLRVVDLSLHWPDMPDKKDVSDWRDESGGTAEAFSEILRRAPVWAPQKPRSMFQGISWADRKLPRKRQAFLVDDWITEEGVSFLGGASSSGKSFLAYHLGMCVARGQDFFDRTVKRCGVVYQAGEGGIGFLDRMEAYARHFEVDDDEDVPFELLPSKINIFSKESKDIDNLIAEIKALSLWLSEPVGLFVIDTLSKAAPGADEISGKDNDVILTNVGRIATECGCHVMLVHHLNADGKKLRGHTSLRDNVDQVLIVTNDKETGIRDLVLDKIKDGQDGITQKFTLLSHFVRTAGEREVTSCVVVSVSEKERLKKEQEKHGFTVSPTERRILVNFFEAVDKHGYLVAAEKEGEKSYPKAAVGKVVIRWDDYRDIYLSHSPEESDRNAATDRIKKEFGRAKTWLIKSGIIGLDSPYMWWNGKPVRGFPRTFPKRRPEDEPQQFTFDDPPQTYHPDDPGPSEAGIQL